MRQIELPLEMGEGWTTKGHLGVTASTGELSDNHDVIRLDTYVSSEAAVTGEKKREDKTAIEVEPVSFFMYCFFVLVFCTAFFFTAFFLLEFSLICFTSTILFYLFFSVFFFPPVSVVVCCILCVCFWFRWCGGFGSF